MGGKRLGILAGVAAVLMSLFFFTERGYEKNQPVTKTNLLHGVSVNAVRSFSITRGKETALVALKNGVWVVPARGDFRADEKRIRSFLFRLSDLQVSQRVTDNPQRFDALGVSDSGVENGRTLITLKGENNDNLAAIYLGGFRKASNSGDLGVQSGQFIRRADQNDVYAVLESPSAPNDIASWIDQILLNISQVKVQRVEQSTISGAEVTPTFALVPASNGERKFELEGGLRDGESLQESLVSKILSGIENVRLVDVVPLAEVEKSGLGLNFDTRTSYSINNGLIYSIDAAKKDENFYLKVSVQFSSDLAEASKKEVEARNLEIEKLRADEAQKPEKERQKVRDPIVLELSDATQATALNKELSSWVYKVAQFQGERYRLTRTELTRPLEDSQGK